MSFRNISISLNIYFYRERENIVVFKTKKLSTLLFFIIIAIILSQVHSIKYEKI